MDGWIDDDDDDDDDNNSKRRWQVNIDLASLGAFNDRLDLRIASLGRLKEIEN